MKKDNRSTKTKKLSKTESYSVDAVNETFALLEDPRSGERLTIPLSSLPEGIEEGDVITFDPKHASWRENQTEKQRRLKKNQSLLEKLLKKE